MKTIQLVLFYEKGNGYYKYWYRIYRYLYPDDMCRHCRVSKPQTQTN
jgi:hypothetical protein